MSRNSSLTLRLGIPDGWNVSQPPERHRYLYTTYHVKRLVQLGTLLELFRTGRSLSIFGYLWYVDMPRTGTASVASWRGVSVQV